MIFLCLTPLFLIINGYYIYETIKWINTLSFIPHRLIKVLRIIIITLCSFASVAIYLAFLMPADINANAQPFLYALRRILKHIGNYHLGVFIYVSMLFALILLIRLIRTIIRRFRKSTNRTLLTRIYDHRSMWGLLNLIFIICLTLYGVNNAKDIRVKEYEISVNKDCINLSDLNIVLAADLHLGYNIGCEQMEQMVQKINAENPDIVIIAGDIFDNEYEALDDPDRLISILSSIESKYGVYGVFGNHDVSEKIIGGFTFDYKNPGKAADDKMRAFLEASNIQIFMDEYILIDDSFYLYGRPDASKPGNGTGTRLSPSEITQSLDLSKPVILIDHEPLELQELADAGIDIDLSGHTHDGQFFPMNLTSRYITWENSAGLLKKDDMYSVVTSGVGLFGPNIRIGTHADICTIKVHFE